MMRTLFIIFICVHYFAQGQGVLPPDSVIKNLNVITLYDNSEFLIQEGQSIFKNNYKVLILNKYADNKKDIVLHYDQFTAINNAKVIHYNLNGEVIKKYKLSDFSDLSGGGSDMASDDRAKYLRIEYDHYPFYIEVSYEISYLGSLFYPTWVPQDEEKQYIVNASFKVLDPLSKGFRYKLHNIDDPKITNTTYEWEIKNISPFEYEIFNKGYTEFIPIVQTAPNDFEMAGYTGNMSSWKTFGQWIHKLNTGKNNLTPAQLSEVRQLVADSPDVFEKARKVYKYVQDRTRYVSIQLGIGGWQPFDASFVHEKKYGDCKALSFYTRSLLDAVGVEAYYTLIKAGSNSPNVQADFPSSQFNHVILTLPYKGDTIWLECTSQTDPFGYLGTFTSDRKALLINEEGGHIINTRSYKTEDNIQYTQATIKLNQDGSAIADVQRDYKGLEISNDNFESVLLKSKSTQDKWFYDKLGWGDMVVKEYQLKELTDEVVPEGGFSANIEFKNAGVFSANRLFFKPSMFTDISYYKLNDKKRTKDIHIKYPYIQSDSIVIIPPDNFYMENNLSDESIDTPFGKYIRKITTNKDGQFVYVRRFQLNKGVFPSTDYQDFKNFIEGVQKKDRQKMVLINKT